MIHVLCRTCGQWEIVGPGHPSVRPSGEGTHELFDRAALLPACECPEDGEGGRPLAFTFMAGTVTATVGGVN